MKTILIFICCLLANGIAFAVPQMVFHIDKIEGKVIDLPKADGTNYVFVKMTVFATSSPEDTKDLYSTIRRKTLYPIQYQTRPRKDQVILVVHLNDLPKGTKVGDKLRIINYSLTRSDVAIGRADTRLHVGRIELNPKG